MDGPAPPACLLWLRHFTRVVWCVSQAVQWAFAFPPWSPQQWHVTHKTNLRPSWIHRTCTKTHMPTSVSLLATTSSEEPPNHSFFSPLNLFIGTHVAFSSFSLLPQIWYRLRLRGCVGTRLVRGTTRSAYDESFTRGYFSRLKKKTAEYW